MDTILVVDDERPLTEVWRRVLERRGYRVLLARDGEEAVTVYHNNQKWISAVLLDFGLPKLDGREVYLKLKELDPNVRALIVSGYLSPDAFAEIEPFATLEFLHKPFMPDDLLMKLDRLLHRGQS